MKEDLHQPEHDVAREGNIQGETYTSTESDTGSLGSIVIGSGCVALAQCGFGNEMLCVAAPTSVTAQLLDPSFMGREASQAEPEPGQIVEQEQFSDTGCCILHHLLACRQTSMTMLYTTLATSMSSSA